MKTSYISTLSLSESSRRSIADLQTQLLKAQTELGTRRHADIGLELGHRTSQTVSFRHDFARLKGNIDANGLVKTRLDMSQNVLSDIRTQGQELLNSLSVAHSGTSDPGIAQGKAEAALNALISGLNTTVNGEYIFGGINNQAKPVADYYTTPQSAAREAVADAFMARFGFSQSAPAAANITAADMQDFLDNEFAALFDEPAWSADWSQASSENTKSRISGNETIVTGENANALAVRKLAQAFTMVADVGVQNLNKEAARSIIDTAMKVLGESMGAMASAQANLGTAQEMVKQANERMSLQADILNKEVNGLEAVDPYEAATRVNTLMSQIETAYALTGRIQKLSLLNYL